MRKTFLVLGACLFVGLLVFANQGGGHGDVSTSIYGFGVEVQPDDEFDDFVRCGMSMFRLEDEKSIGELPALRIMAGGSNSMQAMGADGVEVTFTCGVNAAMTEARYEIAGHVGERLVMNHLATIQLDLKQAR
jgi:hypothetical protein